MWKSRVESIAEILSEKWLGWVYHPVTQWAAHPTTPAKTTANDNFANSGPILMKFGMEVRWRERFSGVEI